MNIKSHNVPTPIHRDTKAPKVSRTIRRIKESANRLTARGPDVDLGRLQTGKLLMNINAGQRGDNSLYTSDALRPERRGEAPPNSACYT
ncbi:hypothetical protein EVAR_64777_1 [Eumeta japonica]|uniref:Uncharacterized protein n=1 Tax=Eumeta variegata TaxID=151549 RepID=A0A4C1ZPI3_EUMVA|nr:hypothetical protein EVAR_64777_1 [Eumeta japonica]